ncbi:jg18022 [Pararge aegeria aegeria]|uniref:Jg18022 protein n=1 Tax=Pararge aegeria aegeria TaxID=348720 RepID=A0A8S4RNM3_9NEOP|nr:jg18022 [Pararge aegeria aegeria]
MKACLSARPGFGQSDGERRPRPPLSLASRRGEEEERPGQPHSQERPVACVEGCTGSGIGAAVETAFSSTGARVAMVGRNESKPITVAARCSNPFVIRADVTKNKDARAVIEVTIEKF